MMFRLYELTRRQTAMFAAAAVVLTIAVAAAVYSCRFNHTYPQELTAIDSLCESRPDSAMALLEGMPKEVMEGDANRMYYGLLKIKAANNLYMVQKDSTIFHIVDYFEDSGDKEKLRDSYYFLGKYYVEHNDAPQALKCFQTALDMSDEKTPLAFKSKVYSQSGTLFLKQDLLDDAIAMYRKSYACDSTLEDTVNMIHNLRDIAQVYKHMDEADSCVAFLHEAYVLSNEIQNQRLLRSVSLVLSSQYLKNNRIKEAKDLLFAVLDSVGDRLKPSAYCIASDIYKKEGKMDSVSYYCHELLNLRNIEAREYASRELADYHSLYGDYEKVRYYLNQNRLYADSVQKANASQSIENTHSLYNYNLREKEIARLKVAANERTLYSMIVGFIVLSISFVFAYLNEKNKKRYFELKLINEHVTELYELAKKKDEKEIENLKSTLDNVLDNKENNENVQKLFIYNLIKDRLECGNNVTVADWKKIDAAVDSAYPLFKSRLYSYYSVNHREYKVCILIKLGFSMSDMATIICRSNSALTSTRISLYKKFFGKEGKAKDFDDFVKSL